LKQNYQEHAHARCTSVFSTHLLSPKVSWRNAGLYTGLAYGPT